MFFFSDISEWNAVWYDSFDLRKGSEGGQRAAEILQQIFFSLLDAPIEFGNRYVFFPLIGTPGKEKKGRSIYYPLTKIFLWSLEFYDKLKDIFV